MLMKMFKIFEIDANNFSTTRPPQLHSLELLAVLKRFIEVPKHLYNMQDEYICAAMFEESSSHKKGIITKSNLPCYLPSNVENLIQEIKK